MGLEEQENDSFGFHRPLIQYSNTPLLHVAGINLVRSKIL